MAGITYKYNIRHRFSLTPDGTTWKDIETHALNNGINPRTFQRDRDITIESDQDIPTERLMIYAAIFNCKLDKMINYQSMAKPFKP